MSTGSHGVAFCGIFGRSFNLRFQGLRPVIELLANLILRVAVALLQLSFELLAIPVNQCPIVVREFAPGESG